MIDISIKISNATGFDKHRKLVARSSQASVFKKNGVVS